MRCRWARCPRDRACASPTVAGRGPRRHRPRVRRRRGSGSGRRPRRGCVRQFVGRCRRWSSAACRPRACSASTRCRRRARGGVGAAGRCPRKRTSPGPDTRARGGGRRRPWRHRRVSGRARLRPCDARRSRASPGDGASWGTPPPWGTRARWPSRACCRASSRIG